MSRAARIVIPGVPYHITQRGHRPMITYRLFNGILGKMVPEEGFYMRGVGDATHLAVNPRPSVYKMSSDRLCRFAPFRIY